MFRDVPGCSGMFHVPGFIDGRRKLYLNPTVNMYQQMAQCARKTSARYANVLLTGEVTGKNESYAEVTKRNGDDNELDSLKIMPLKGV